MPPKAKRHRHINDSVKAALTKPALKRLCRRGGVKRISGGVLAETQKVVKTFLENVLHDAVTYCEHARRKTIMTMDILMALKRNGRTLFGFDDAGHWGLSADEREELLGSDRSKKREEKKH